ncbi:MAG: alpha/beta hydrolase [Candidatus Promineifilaceae bacterium]
MLLPIMSIIWLAILTTGWRDQETGHSQLRQIKTPTLLLLGDYEIVYNHNQALQRATRLIPHIETTLIPGAGHALNFDQPEMVNERILPPKIEPI